MWSAKSKIMKFLLVSGEKVEVPESKIRDKSNIIISNPYWRVSGLLNQEEVMAYLNQKANHEVLKRIKRISFEMLGK